jgi:hypothetical protein
MNLKFHVKPEIVYFEPHHVDGYWKNYRNCILVNYDMRKFVADLDCTYHSMDYHTYDEHSDDDQPSHGYPCAVFIGMEGTVSGHDEYYTCDEQWLVFYSDPSQLIEIVDKAKKHVYKSRNLERITKIQTFDSTFY